MATDTEALKDLHEKAVELLNHLEDVLSDEDFNKIDHRLWNDVSMFMAHHNHKPT